MKTLVVAIALAACGSASASITVAGGAARPALRVDAQGNAQVSWTAGGGRRTLLVPAHGSVLPGARLPGRDVSRPSPLRIPFGRVVRQTPDGRLWALQAWQVQPGAAELHFSRWRGSPLEVSVSFDGRRVTGSAAFQGTPVTGFSPTPEGKRQREYAYLDCLCGGRWTRMQGVALAADGSFALLVKPRYVGGTAFRAIVPGPNRGTVFAPDGLGSSS
jgi:hypothetical protein